MSTKGAPHDGQVTAKTLEGSFGTKVLVQGKPSFRQRNLFGKDVNKNVVIEQGLI